MVNKIGYRRTKKKRLYLEKVLEMREQGFNITEIAETVPVSLHSVHAWLQLIEAKKDREAKVAEKAQDKPKEAEPAKTIELDQMVANVVEQLGKESKPKSSTDPLLENQLLKEKARSLPKALIEQTIKTASLESTLKDEREKRDEEKSPQEKDKLIKQIRQDLKHEHMRAEAYDTMIDIAEDELGVNIRKKPVAK